MRFYGAVGYADDEETAPGVWSEIITEYPYYGDDLRISRRLESSALIPPTLSDNVVVDNSISIMADAYAFGNFHKMRYVSWNGSKWKITNIRVERPRLILTIGELWNGNTPGTANPS